MMPLGLVVSETQTCFACPTQWEGDLANGQHFYFRFRHGTASLGIGESVSAAICDEQTVYQGLGGGLDGVLDYDQYLTIRDELLIRRLISA
jgi:hypothetical protein